jgi:hypothetical protein
MNQIKIFFKDNPLLTFLVIAFAPIRITISLAAGNPTLQAVMTLLNLTGSDLTQKSFPHMAKQPLD